jgi:hypothetical protein
MSNPDLGSDIYSPLQTGHLHLINLTRLASERACILETVEIDPEPGYSVMSCTCCPPLNKKSCEEDYTSDSHRLTKVVTLECKKELLITRNLYEGLEQSLP